MCGAHVFENCFSPSPFSPEVVAFAGQDRCMYPAADAGAGEPASGLMAMAGQARGLPVCRFDQF